MLLLYLIAAVDAVSHPLIPCYLDYFEVNSPTIKGFALVQTYIPAETLEQYLQTGRTFTEAEIKEIAKAILEILIYLHELHPPVIHHDIKPSNILLSDRSGNSVGQVYLIDFGSVQIVLATETDSKTVVGTYGYMPQEQFGGRTVTASDLYSLGATLIYLVTGTHPADLPQKDFQIQFEQVAHLSPGLTRWLKSMTEPSLERRFSSASAALKALDESEFPGTNVLSISKPAGSKIQLTKNLDSLEILIPPVGFHPLIVFIGLFAIGWNSFNLLWTVSILFVVPFPANILAALFSLPFWGIGCFMVYTVLFALFGHIRLHLNQQQIALTYDLLGFTFDRPRPSLRENISKLLYVPKHSPRNFEGSPIQLPAQLEIWAGVQKYQLYMKFHINSIIQSEAELEWLARELSDWLGIPIQRE